jgi:hypothetical protein
MNGINEADEIITKRVPAGFAGTLFGFANFYGFT